MTYHGETINQTRYVCVLQIIRPSKFIHKLEMHFTFTKVQPLSSLEFSKIMPPGTSKLIGKAILAVYEKNFFDDSVANFFIEQSVLANQVGRVGNTAQFAISMIPIQKCNKSTTNLLT